jgi:hypothetical protein
MSRNLHGGCWGLLRQDTAHRRHLPAAAAAVQPRSELHLPSAWPGALRCDRWGVSSIRAVVRGIGRGYRLAALWTCVQPWVCFKSDKCGLSLCVALVTWACFPATDLFFTDWPRSLHLQSLAGLPVLLPILLTASCTTYMFVYMPLQV